MPRTAIDSETGEEITVIDADEAEEEQQTPAELDYENTLNTWLADLGGAMDAAISVYRYDEKTNKPAFVDSIGAQEMDGVTLFKTLKEEYGGGKFRIQMRAGGRIVKTQTLQVEPPPKSAQNNGGGFGTQDLPALIRELKGSESNDTGLILQMMQQQNQQFQTMMVEMFKAIGNKEQPQQMTMADMVGAVSQLKEMSTPQQQDATELILKGVELVQAVKGEGEGGEANLYSLLQTGLKEVGGSIAQIGQMTPPPGMAPAPGAQPGAAQPMQITAQDQAPMIEQQPAQPQPNPQPGPLASANEVPEQLKPFEPHVNWLCGLAAQDKSPELYAEVIIDQMGEELAYAWVGQKEGRDMLFNVFTQAQPYAAWFEAVGHFITDFLQEDIETESPDSVLDQNDEAPHNAGETDAPTTLEDESVSSGPTSPGLVIDGEPATHIDGDSERPGGHSGDPEIDGAVGDASEGTTADQGTSA